MATTIESQTTPPANGPPNPIRPRSLSWWLKKVVTAGLVFALGLLLIVAIGAAQRLGWIRSGGGGAVSNAAAAGNQVFTCSMHPQIRQPAPGRCPICGMELVVAAGGSANLDELSVKIDTAQRRLANIETKVVQSAPVTAQIQSIGAIAIDESRMATISSYISGRIERLFADYTGVEVAKGDHLAVVYSPQLYSVQVEYLEARKSLTSMTSNALEIVRQTQVKLVDSARHRLVELGMTPDQIEALHDSSEAQSRLTIYAAMGGTVTDKLLVEGDYVTAGQPIYRIANLSTVWLMLELFPEDASRIRFGQRVRAEIQSLPGEPFEGRVAFIDPTVDPKKRTVGVRVEFLNDDRRLRPGDYAAATISIAVGPLGESYDEGLAGKWISPMHPQVIRDAPGECPICGMQLVPTSRYGYSEHPVEQPASLFVPRSAVLLAGNNSVVYVEDEPGRFEIRAVTLGPILRDRAIILNGLKEGELVATAGNFLIDSQMQLAGKPSLIDPTRAIAAQGARNTPLTFPRIHVTPIAGQTGEQLEQLFAAYIAIQKALADDKQPSETDAKTLHTLATDLAQAAELDDVARNQLTVIATHSEHLHHLSLSKVRLEAFRPISHAILTLATQVRGTNASSTLYHMFCPMVKGGAGDWLQDADTLRNPYWGNEMLTCGELIQRFPLQGHTQPTRPVPPAKEEN
ncbi:MAG: efflux RND transporter periplasmic adaptor subunit [Planctomycetaceae bacterium]|nr:efflux RND transporter periplasmic adaptor subunit [Planctomycetaceae bacterium]